MAGIKGRNMFMRILWIKYIINIVLYLLIIYVFWIWLTHGRWNILKWPPYPCAKKLLKYQPTGQSRTLFQKWLTSAEGVVLYFQASTPVASITVLHTVCYHVFSALIKHFNTSFVPAMDLTCKLSLAIKKGQNTRCFKVQKNVETMQCNFFCSFSVEGINTHTLRPAILINKYNIIHAVRKRITTGSVEVFIIINKSLI